MNDLKNEIKNLVLKYATSTSNNFRTIKLDTLIGNRFNKQEMFFELKTYIESIPSCDVIWNGSICKIKIQDSNNVLKHFGCKTDDDKRKDILQKLSFCSTSTSKDFINNLTDKYVLNEKTYDDVVMTAMFLDYVTSDDYQPSDKRTVSSLIYKQSDGSKIIEKKSGIISKILNDVMDWNDETISDIMTFHQFENPIFIYGNIYLNMDNIIINGILTPFTTLFHRYFKQLNTKCNRLITIENKTTFNRWIRRQHKEKNTDDIVLYIGGFPNKHVVELIKLIIKQNSLTNIFHFGDLDKGGFRIRKYIEEQINVPVKIHGWTEENIKKYGYKMDYKNISAFEPLEIYAKTNGLGAEQENIPILF